MSTATAPGCRFRSAVTAMIAVFTLTAACVGFAGEPQQTTTVYLVRHAEKAGQGRDPELSEAGRARAQALAHVLVDAELDALFVTQFIRTRQTAAPLAAITGLTPQPYAANDAQDLAARLLQHHAGQRVLVVGHSNTLDDLAAALGANGLADLAESQFDRLFVVVRTGDQSSLHRLRYGAETP